LVDKERPYGAVVERYNFTYSSTTGIRRLARRHPGWRRAKGWVFFVFQNPMR
jgi:hypothetical protein